MKDQFYKDFADKREDFYKEPRAFCYDLSRRLIEEAKKECQECWYTHDKTVQGILIIIFCWNFAARATKNLNFEHVRELLARNKIELTKLENYSIMSIDKPCEDGIRKVFSDFRDMFGQTGASKALSLLNPYLFVMWDTKIRNKVKRFIEKDISNGEFSEHYINFLNGMKEIAQQYDFESKLPYGAILAKKIDEYHFVKFIMEPKKD